MSSNVIQFPGAQKQRVATTFKGRRIYRAHCLPGFRVVTGEAPKVTDLTQLRISRVLELDWSAPLVIEFTDPLRSGKRDINVHFFWHNERLWKMKWFDRGAQPGCKRYGLVPVNPVA